MPGCAAELRFFFSLRKKNIHDTYKQDVLNKAHFDSILGIYPQALLFPPHINYTAIVTGKNS